MILYRPVGQKEYELIEKSDYSKFPPRLKEQPIFYPVLNLKYARFIASNWNTRDENSLYIVYVLAFEIKDDYIKNYEIQTVGSEIHKEYWIPAEDLNNFNDNIIGKIKVLESYTKFYKLDKTHSLPIFETNRLILRPIELTDAADIFEYASDLEATKYMLFNTHKNIEETKAYIKYANDKYLKNESFDYAIVLKENNKVIGAGGAFSISYVPHRVEIGYILNKNYWGQGFINEAMSELITFFFDVLNIHRVEAIHFSQNEKSGKVMKKLGMTYEGERIDSLFVRGFYYSIKMYGLINPNHQ